MADRSNDADHRSWLYHPRFPSDWSGGSLYSLATWINGMAFRNIHFSDAGRPVIKIAEIKNGITTQTKFTEAAYDESYFTTKGDMLFSWSGQPETSIDVFWWRGPDGWLNQHIFKVLPNTDLCLSEFLYYLFFPIDTTFYVVSRLAWVQLSYLYYALMDLDLPHLSADSAVPGLNRNIAYMSRLLLPSREILEVFARHTRLIMDRVHQGEQENRTLAALRDALLPKLISGELRVPDAERFLTEVSP